MDHLYSIDITDHTLSHHGVKGMKWGVRKQPKTSGGRIQKKIKSFGFKTSKKTKTGSSRKTVNLQRKTKSSSKTTDLNGKAKIDPYSLSNEELQYYNTRQALIKQYNSNVPRSTRSKYASRLATKVADTFVDDIGSYIGKKSASYVTSSIDGMIAKQIKKRV